MHLGRAENVGTWQGWVDRVTSDLRGASAAAGSATAVGDDTATGVATSVVGAATAVYGSATAIGAGTLVATDADMGNSGFLHPLL